MGVSSPITVEMWEISKLTGRRDSKIGLNFTLESFSLLERHAARIHDFYCIVCSSSFIYRIEHVALAALPNLVEDLELVFI